MRIHLIKEQTIKKFIVKNAAAKSCFEDWLSKIKYANWQIPIKLSRCNHLNIQSFIRKNNTILIAKL
jgi:mRNA-degrading endonuclease HigB of HigAB toxin-antitoxin module